MATKEKKEKSEVSSKSNRAAMTVDRIRALLAQVVWLLFVLAALFLAVGALLIALKANRQNDLVDFILKGADRVDLGIFSRTDGIKKFGGQNPDSGDVIKNALFNWGIGAIAWLVVGRIVDRIIKP